MLPNLLWLDVERREEVREEERCDETMLLQCPERIMEACPAQQASEFWLYLKRKRERERDLAHHLSSKIAETNIRVDVSGLITRFCFTN